MELLVVIGVISLLMAISVPAFNVVRAKACQLKGMASLKGVVAALNVFANDHEDHYPPSVGTVGFGDHWTWWDPRRLVGVEGRTPTMYRSMSTYLREYIERAKVISCPSVPFDYEYLQQVWDAGEDWDCPSTASTVDIMTGSFCFYWNYEGLVEPTTEDDRWRFFKGPRGPAAGRGFSKLLAADYLGYGCGRDDPPPPAYASCEPFDGARPQADATTVSHWVRTDVKEIPDITLRAAYVDGHVERSSGQDVVPMRVILDREKLTLYTVGGVNSCGLFYLPTGAMR